LRALVLSEFGIDGIKKKNKGRKYTTKALKNKDKLVIKIMIERYDR